MIINLTRVTVTTALALLPLAAATAPAGAAQAPTAQVPAATQTPDAAPAPARVAETLSLAVAVNRLPVATESRTGYTRDAFKHWNAGLKPDGCNTRNEVLISEAVQAPTVGARCALSGGSWWSYYDDTVVDSASSLDIDHMVPLAEAWDSGAHGWTAARREAYANDQGQASSLVAVTAKSNRSKADQDPAQWLPPAADALCRYTSDWLATKLRWALSIDGDEQRRLYQLAAGCPSTRVTFTPAP
ncbi:HNH endonuclease family protein [Streptomyces sp. NPDC020412]|uniref:HNH endonuclease family protein n=1 Tax=Streptomyces sp. NPDC020412 TaxID=3365073 RepID=UPI0037A49263